MIRYGIIWIILIFLPVQGLISQDDQRIKFLQYQDISSPVLKSTNADTVRIELNIQVGQSIDSIAIMGECSNAATYLQQTTFPSEITYQTGDVTVDNLSVMRAEYNVAVPWATPIGTYEGEVLYTISRASGVCKIRLLMFTITVVPTEIPVADFIGDPRSIVEGSTVIFTDQSLNPVTSWSWDFGDGQSSTEQNPHHTYNDVGSYTVSLTAANHVGSNTIAKEGYVNVAAGGTPGLKLWNLTMGLGTWSSPTIGYDGTIYQGSLEFRLHAINPDGTLKWSHQTSGAVTSIAAGRDKIYFVSQNHLYAVDLNGNRLWTYPVNGSVYDLTLGVDGIAYIIVSTQPALRAINSNGVLDWGLNIGYNSLMPKRLSLAPDGTIYMVSYSSSEQVYKLNAINPSGEVKWTRNTPPSTYFNYRTSPAIDEDGTVYLGGLLNFYAIDRNGKDKWVHVDDGGEFHYEPTIGKDGDIYTVFYKHNDVSKVVSLSRDGNTNWSFIVSGHPRFLSPVTVGSDEVLYFTTSDSLLYALNADGSLYWTYQFEDDNPVYIPAIPVIGNNGSIYVNYGMNLYALTSSGDGLADSPWPKSGQNIFNTGRKINPAPWLISPGNDSLDLPKDVFFEWGTIYGDIIYDLELDLNQDFTGTTLVRESTVQTGLELNNLQLSSYYYWRARANGVEGQSAWSPAWRFVTGNAAGIEDQKLVNSGLYSLEQNYPNPFSEKTIINYSIPKTTQVTIRVHDIKGKEVMRFDEGLITAGSYDLHLNRKSLQCGIYYYQLLTDDVQLTKKLIITFY